MLQRRDARTVRILVLQLGNLIGNLLALVPARLHRSLHVPNMLEHTAVVLKVLRKDVFLLAHLGQHHAQLVGDVGDGIIVGRLAPFGELACDGGALAAGGFVGADGAVLALDQAAELAAQLGALLAAEGVDAEAVPAAGGALCASGLRVSGAYLWLGNDDILAELWMELSTAVHVHCVWR